MSTHPRSPTCAGRVTLGRLLLFSFAMWIVGVVVSRSAAEPPFSRWRWTLSSGMRSRAMAEDWLQNHLIERMTVREVLADLGDPDIMLDYWLYDAGPDVPRSPSNLRGESPRLLVWFSVRGTVRSVSGADLGEGPAQSAFDAKAWQESAGSDRRALALALLDEGLSDSFGRTDILALLGPPDFQRPNVEFRYEIEPSQSLEFFVGPDETIVRAGIDTRSD